MGNSLSTLSDRNGRPAFFDGRTGMSDPWNGRPPHCVLILNAEASQMCKIMAKYKLFVINDCFGV